MSASLQHQCPLCPAEILLGLSEVKLWLASSGGCLAMAVGWSARGVGHLCAREFCGLLLPMAAGEAQPSFVQLCMILPWIRWAGCEGKAEESTKITLSE